MIMTSDNECSILALVVKGMKGEQHKVILFDWDKAEPLTMVNRAATTDLEFNMNSHIRPRTQIFIVQTESNNTVTAKQLEFDKDEAEAAGARQMPVISFTRPQRGFAKDCWIYVDHNKD